MDMFGWNASHTDAKQLCKVFALQQLKSSQIGGVVT